jgi:hypothetical protein
MVASAAVLWGVISGASSAATYTFDDLYTEWPGYETALNGVDAYGNPELLGLTVVTDDAGYLDSITISYDANYGFGLSNDGDYNSLFINSQWLSTEQYDNWDYYLTISNSCSLFPTVTGYDLTSQTWSYTYAGEDGQRIGHPNGIDTCSLTADNGLWESILWGTNSDGTELLLSLNFADEAIQLGDAFVVGSTHYCANDNFVASNVPLPTTIMLLGSGLVCMAGLRKRRHG